MPGPVPKRSEQRRRRNKPVREPVTPAVGAALAPDLPGRDELHPQAVALWDALVVGVEAQFYTAAVWSRAVIHVHVFDRWLRGDRKAALYKALQADWKSLLVDVAEQRRLGIGPALHQAGVHHVSPYGGRHDRNLT
jgi:hypothetical protein